MCVCVSVCVIASSKMVKILISLHIRWVWVIKLFKYNYCMQMSDVARNNVMNA